MTVNKSKPKKQIRQAQRTRSAIKRTFDALTDEQLNASDVLHDVPACLRRVRVFDVIRRLPGMGGDGASKVLRKAKVWPVARMGSLTAEERDAILEHLPPRAKR